MITENFIESVISETSFCKILPMLTVSSESPFLYPKTTCSWKSPEDRDYDR
jgi:hypothetical protein